MRPARVELVVDAPATEDDRAAFWARAQALLEESRAEVAVCDVGRLAADALSVDTIARLALIARRLGLELRLRHSTPELRELVAFMGLAEVLRVEPGGQTEAREERRGLEEERQLGDPPV